MPAQTAPSGNTKLGIALRGFIALAVAMGVGRFAFTPQFPVMQADLGLSLGSGGWLAGANYLGYLVGAILAGRLGVSAAGLMRSGLWMVVASTAAMAAPGPFSWWLVARFVAGVASAWVMVGAVAVVFARLAQFKGAKLDGLAFAGVGAGIAVAGLVCHVGLLMDARATSLWLALAAIAFAGVLFVLADAAPQPENQPRTVPVPQPAVVPTTLQPAAQQGALQGAAASANLGAPNARVLVICYGLFGFGYILPATYLPAQARELLQEPALFGWVWPIFGLAAAVSTLLIAWAARWSRLWIWAAAQLVMAAGVLLPIAIAGLGGLALAALCVGGTFMVITLLALQEIRVRAGAKARQWLAAMTAAFALGQLVGPLLSNALLAVGWGFNAGLWLAAFALLASSGLLAVLALQAMHTTPDNSHGAV